MRKTITTITTLGDLRAEKYTVWAHCTVAHCGRGWREDLDALIAEYGAGYVFINESRIASTRTCGCTGHIGGTMRYVPPSKHG